MTAAQVLGLAREQGFVVLVKWPDGQWKFYKKVDPAMWHALEACYISSVKFPSVLEFALNDGATPASLGLEVGE